MNIEELYSNITNPLDDPNFIDNLLDIYTAKHSNFYAGFVQAQYNKDKNKKVVSRYSLDYRDEFYVFLFNNWKKAISYGAKHPELYESYRRKEIRLVDKYLRDKKPTTWDEVMEVLEANNESQEVQDAIDDFNFDKLNYYYSGWNHIDSREVYAKTHDRNSIDHRIYLNCDSLLLHFIGFEFIKRCMKRKLKYYFKFADIADRDDTMVFYSDTESLPQYVKILQEIYDEYELNKYGIFKPPILTGRINDWLGYGSEPNAMSTSEKRFSFNTLRRDHLEKCIYTVATSWITHNLDVPVIKNGYEIPYRQYLLIKIYEDFRDRLADFQIAKKVDFNSDDFKRAFLTFLNQNFDAVIACFDTNNYTNLRFEYQGQHISIPSSTFKVVFKEQVDKLKNIEDFKNHLFTFIKETAKDYGISDNYAVDLEAVKLFEDAIAKEKEEERKTKVYQKRREWLPMTDEEILLARRQLGFID